MIMSITNNIYTKNSGLFDLMFTENDIKFCVIIFLGWCCRMYMERKNQSVDNPSLEDYLFSLIIAYAITGGIYQFCIYKGWNIGYIMFPLFIVSMISIDFVRWLFSADGQIKSRHFFSSLADIGIKLLQKISKP